MNQITRGKARVGKLIPMSVNTATIDLAGGHADQTLTPEQLMTNIIFLTGAADAGFNVIFNVAYPNTYVIINGSGQTATLKNAAGTTTTVADGAVGMIQNDGTNIIALTGQTGTQVTTTGAQTLTNKTLTSPIINGGKGVVSFAEVLFTEAGAGTYTGAITIPAGATVLDVIVDNQVAWDAATSAAMDVGDGDDANGFFAALDMKTLTADVNGAGGVSSKNEDAGSGAYKGLVKRYTAEGTISGVITSVGAGTAGRTRLFVVYALPSAVANATKA